MGVYLVGIHVESPESPFPPYIKPKLMVLEQFGNRKVYRSFYLDNDLEPMSKVRRVVPESFDSPTGLMDAVIAFYPEWFKECKTLPKVLNLIKENEFLDLDLEMPEGWNKLRKEAYPYYFKLRIDEAEFGESVK